MDLSKAGESSEKVTAIGKYSWPQVTKWLLVVMVLYALGSVFISNPFMTRSATATPLIYSNIMYLHGLLVGLAGLVSLVACEVFEMSNRVRKTILTGAVIGILLAVIGGVFNRSIDLHWMKIQVAGFFALDVVLVSLIFGFIYTKNAELRQTLTYWVGLLASISFLIAAVTGDIAGAILDFGDSLPLIGWWANFVGLELSVLLAHLIMSHSHEIIVAILALLAAMFSWKYGRHLVGLAANVKKVGEWFVLIGTIVMTVMYVLAGFGGPLLQSPVVIHSAKVDGIAHPGLPGLMLIDVVTGMGIMVGGLLILGAILFGQRMNDYKVSKQMKAAIYSISLTWSFMVLILVCMGYFMELNSSKYAGELAANGFSYNFLHQDIAFFLFPALMVVMVLVQHWLNEERGRIVNILLRLSVALCFLGSMVYVLMTPNLLGLGYWIIALGFLLILTAMAYFFIYGSFSTNRNVGLSEDQMRAIPSEHEQSKIGLI